MAKGEVFSLSTKDFTISFHGPIPSLGAYALREFVGGSEAYSSNPSASKRITLPSTGKHFPLIQIDCLTDRYKLDECDLNIASKIEQDGKDVYLPLFFENVDYQVLLSNLGSTRFSLWHEHSSIRSSLASFDRHKIISGRLNFRNHVGITSFEIQENNKTHIRLTFTVFSIKVDFFEDRQLMLDELATVHNTLMMRLFTPTKSLGSSKTDRNLGVEWLTNFHNLSADLLKTIKRIETKAHHQIQTTNEIIAIHKIKKPNKSFTRQINSRGKKELLNRHSLILERRKVKVNTAENRYIKFLMRQLAVSGKKWITYVNSSNWESFRRLRENETIIRGIESNLREIQAALRNDFWVSVGDELPTLQNKTSFLFHELFVRFEKIYKTINRAINVHLSGSRYLHTISMDRLYEIWAYCKLAEVISGIVNGASSKIIPKAKVDTFQAVLSTGRNSRVSIDDKIAIGTKWLFTTNTQNTYFTPLIPQEPDLIFEVRYSSELNLLDAKYRINILAKRGTTYISLGISELISEDLTNLPIKYQPKDEDINVMHRYKDAIRKFVTIEGNDSTRPATRNGLILYPHKPSHAELESIKRDISSLREFSIGAVPLAPGTIDDNWLHTYRDLDKLLPSIEGTEQIRIFANVIGSMLTSV
jgi:predicted component of viral defense system (DUF524 family)